MDTLYQKLTSLPDAAVFLKPGLTFADLDRLAMATTHHQAAQQLNDERKKLFVLIHRKHVA